MDLEKMREEIDVIDDQLVDLFSQRMAIAGRIAEYKKENGLPVLDADREKEAEQHIESRRGGNAGLCSGIVFSAF